MKTTDAVGPSADPHNPLLRILGLGFGLAIVVGGTIGVGILRSPGPIAEQLGSVWLILFAWILGGVYALLSANYLAELATAIPRAGGYFVYALRAYGRFGGFIAGWSDWLYQTLGLSFIAVVFGEYSVELFETSFVGDRIVFTAGALAVLTVLNWIGLRAGSTTQKVTSVLKAVALIAFVAACFIFGGQGDAVAKSPASTSPVTSFASLAAFILAFQLVLGTYDGWHSAIYFAEEDTNPAQNVPRSLFLGILAIIAIYLLVNIALFYVLPISQIAVSKFAGGDATAAIFGDAGGQIVTALALLSLIGIMNALLLMCPRILLALGRERLFAAKAAEVNTGGTPVFSLAVTALAAIVLSSIGTFEMLLAISQFFAVTITILLVVSLFVLRKNEPELPRPYRAWGYPYLPFMVLVIAVLLFFGYIFSNPYPSLYALILLAVSYPIFRLIRPAEAE